MKAENRGQLVRGVVIFSQWRAGYLSMENALDPNNDRVSVCFTPWHRHDDDLSILDNELNSLQRVVSNFKEVDGCTMYYEYKDYNE